MGTIGSRHRDEDVRPALAAEMFGIDAAQPIERFHIQQRLSHDESAGKANYHVGMFRRNPLESKREAMLVLGDDVCSMYNSHQVALYLHDIGVGMDGDNDRYASWWELIIRRGPT